MAIYVVMVRVREEKLKAVTVAVGGENDRQAVLRAVLGPCPKHIEWIEDKREETIESIYEAVRPGLLERRWPGQLP